MKYLLAIIVSEAFYFACFFLFGFPRFFFFAFPISFVTGMLFGGFWPSKSRTDRKGAK